MFSLINQYDAVAFSALSACITSVLHDMLSRDVCWLLVGYGQLAHIEFKDRQLYSCVDPTSAAGGMLQLLSHVRCMQVLQHWTWFPDNVFLL